MDAKKEASALDTVGSRVLAHLAAAQPAAEADVKALEAHGNEKLEVSAKQMMAAAAAFDNALDVIAKAAAAPALDANSEPAGNQAQDLNGPPRAIGTGCRMSARRSRTSSRSPVMRGTSPWVFIPTDSRARSSSRWRRRVDGFRADGRICDFDLAGAAARGAAEGAVREVCAHAV